MTEAAKHDMSVYHIELVERRVKDGAELYDAENPNDSITARGMCVTYRFKSSSSQDPLCRRGGTTTIALEIPHDVASAQLGEHLRDLLDLGWVDGIATSAGPTGTGGTIVAVKEPSNDKERHYRKCEEGRYIQRGLIVVHCALADGGAGIRGLGEVRAIRAESRRRDASGPGKRSCAKMCSP